MKKLILIAFLAIGCVLYAQPVLNGLAIESVTVEKLPGISESGIEWDAFSYPDICFVVFDSLDNEIYISDTYQDVGPDQFPLTWRIEEPFILKNGNQQYKFAFFDIDLTKNERMDKTVLYSFDANSYEFDIMINTIKYNSIRLLGVLDYLME